MGDFVVPEWMETAADREAREERERMAEQRLIQAQREAHNEAIRICSNLVYFRAMQYIDSNNALTTCFERACL